MRTTERLRKLGEWTYNTCCKGRKMKTPAKGMDISQIVKTEPKCFIGYYPTRPDKTGWESDNPMNTVPSILIMPTQSFARNMEEQRFDRYSGISRPKELGQQLNCQALFSVYEDGVRMPGFIDSMEAGEMDMSLMREGTGDGLGTVLNWMDDFVANLLGQKIIPGTDLSVNEASVDYGLYSDQKYINDKRPIYYGIVDVSFWCYAEEKENDAIQKLLR